ncbi:hypothetical protein DBV05_g12743 [Lasiodiplodia theobromae]|uniref:Uncharacterized protein n=1 Tax=Lasiodiplodia theobromae TaxID=45133 RepID=A0A5N5CTA7_9PEZI|nr:hypothetical protein DBV05_g12743 [Lasiodiplodia theobromae]
MELMKTEKHQNQYYPLQPYTEEDLIIKRLRAWKQVLMFFVRTQLKHDWRSPEYKFTHRQFKAFVRLIEEAELVVNGGDERELEGEEEKEEEEEEESEEEKQEPR